MLNMRKAYGEALVELGQANPDVVVLSADVSNSDFCFMFAERSPTALSTWASPSSALVDVAAGLAYSGKIPFANTFAFLFATRALEMVRTHLCYGGANVKLMGAYAGLSDSFDGPTHHSITDLAIMRSLPNMTVVVPGDTVALAAAAAGGRVARPGLLPPEPQRCAAALRRELCPAIGKAVPVRPGGDVTVVGRLDGQPGAGGGRAAGRRRHQPRA